MASGNQRIFISYSHGDAPLAAAAATALAQLGIPFFIDQVELAPGDSLRNKIGSALDTASALVALLSERSTRSAWVQDELTVVRERGVRVVPVKCDDHEWPASIRLNVRDALHVDGCTPSAVAYGISRAFHQHLEPSPSASGEGFFKLSTRPRAPYARLSRGTLQTALEDTSLGPVALVVPTDASVDLKGRATSSVLDFLGIEPSSLASRRHAIDSRRVCHLWTGAFQGHDVHLLASTVFNHKREFCAEDQWRAAGAVMEAASALGCSVVLVPPMGTGPDYEWPRGASTRNWLYGAIQWVRRNPLMTERGPWPILCQPGAVSQDLLAQYLGTLSLQRLEQLEGGQFQFTLTFEGVSRTQVLARPDMVIGSAAARAFEELRGRHDLVAIHPEATFSSRPEDLRYELGVPFNKTAFSDGDEIQLVSRPGR